ncbi:MAG: hypothetical protein J6K33_09010 [Alistipes sp.]|nr:hypothetical protein [Alistipes sp.]
MKTFKTILAVAVAAMAFVGCAKEQNVELNEKVTMTYSVSLDSASGTRAFDGSNVDKLDYKMYLLNDGDTTPTEVTGTVEKNGASFPVTLEFLKGQQYMVTFIAYNSANFGTDKWCKYTNDSKQIVEFDYTKDAEDLFTGVFTLSASDTTTSLSLARPLAQVNLYLSENDVTKATALGFEATGGVTFTLSKMANQYNLLTGTASGSAAVKSYSGTVAAADNGYHHLGSALVLGGQNVEGTISSIGNVQYGSTPHAVPSVPTVANHKTNVKFSSLLVGSVAYTVTLTTGFDGTEKNYDENGNEI